jgi:hypothetical protein
VVLRVTGWVWQEWTNVQPEVREGYRCNKTRGHLKHELNMHSCSYLVWLVPDNNFGPLSAPSLHVMSLSIPHKMVRRGPGPGTRGVGVGTRPVPPADDFTLALVAGPGMIAAPNSLRSDLLPSTTASVHL